MRSSVCRVSTGHGNITSNRNIANVYRWVGNDVIWYKRMVVPYNHSIQLHGEISISLFACKRSVYFICMITCHCWKQNTIFCPHSIYMYMWMQMTKWKECYELFTCIKKSVQMQKNSWKEPLWFNCILLSIPHFDWITCISYLIKIISWIF